MYSFDSQSFSFTKGLSHVDHTLFSEFKKGVCHRFIDIVSVGLVVHQKKKG